MVPSKIMLKILKIFQFMILCYILQHSLKKGYKSTLYIFYKFVRALQNCKMAAPMRGLFFFARSISRPSSASFLLKGSQKCIVCPQNVIVRNISQDQARKNKLVFYKTIGKFAALFVLLGVTSPYWSQLQHAGTSWEPRRDKKRRKIAAERAALERSDESGSSNVNHGLLPAVKAAEVVEGHEGIGYVPPRSKRFNFIADAVEVAAPAVVYIEIHGRFVQYFQNKQKSCKFYKEVAPSCSSVLLIM